MKILDGISPLAMPLEWRCDVQASIRAEDPPKPAPTPEPAATPSATPPTSPDPTAASAAGGFARRIDELIGNWRGEQRAHQSTQDALAQANETIAALRAGRPDPHAAATHTATPTGGATPPGTRLMTQAEIDATANARAVEIAAQTELNRRSLEVAQSGIAKFGQQEWQSKMGGFGTLGGIPPHVLEAAVATGRPAEVLYALASDLNQAYTVFKLPPATAAIEVAKLSGTALSPAPVTGLGNPVNGRVRDGGTPAPIDLSDEKVPIDEWMRERNKQVAERDRI